MSKWTAVSSDDYYESIESPRRPSLLPATVICAYCDAEMQRPPVMSSHPMCSNCRDKRLHGGAARTEGAA
jgi:hypothetical protein